MSRGALLGLIWTLVIFAGCSSNESNDFQAKDLSGIEVDETVSTLQLSGDIMEGLQIEGKEVDLGQWIHDAQPIYDAYDVTLIASDGFMVVLDGETIGGTSLVYNDQDRWFYQSDQHPVNSGIKDISEVIVVKKDFETPNHAYGLNLVTKETTFHQSVGELLTNTYESVAFEDGVSELKGVRINVMKRKKCIRLSAILTEEIEQLLIMTADGDHHYEKVTDAYIEIAKEGLHYMSLDQSVYIRNIEGLMVNPPSRSVMDNFYDASYYLEDGQKVLTLFIDGYSYDQYTYIKTHRPELFLASISNVEQAITVFKPVTNAGFAAMVSGASPATNGVLDRSYRQVLVPTIFDLVRDLGHESILVEGNTNILQLSTEVLLNNDSNNDGYIDDEIFLSAQESIYEGYQYAMVHFHSVDDAGHDYGSLSEETIERLSVIDGYVETLAKAWDGKVIIVSDHGMHNSNDGGDHGEFRHEDLLIPYVIYSN